MLSNEQFKGIAKKLLAQSLIPEADVNNLFEKAVDCAYWHTLCPELGIMTKQDLEDLKGEPLSPEQAVWASAHLERHGYFQIPDIIAPTVVARMCKAVETLRSSGWPPV